MKDKKHAIEMSYKILKYVAITFLCVFGILIANYYYYVKNYTAKLAEELNIIIFFDKSFQDGASLKPAIEEVKLISVKEYVDSKSAYLKAVEDNPFLKDLSIPEEFKSIQAYAIAVPKFIPDEKFIVNMKNTLENIPNIDEIVFEASIFKRFTEAKKFLLFYQKAFFIFIVVIFIIFAVKCTACIMENETDLQKFVTCICSYMSYASLGFLALWSVCTYLRQPLFVGKEVVLSIIFFAGAFGIISDKL